MVETILNNIFSETIIAGIECSCNGQDSVTITGVLLGYKDGKVSLLKELVLVENLHQLFNKLPKGIPCAISITGKCVFQKEVFNHHEFENDKLVTAILPTVEPNDFYWQLAESESGSQLAVIKKDILDKLLYRMFELKINVQLLSLSYYSLIPNVELVLQTDTKLTLLCYQLWFADGIISRFETFIPDQRTTSDRLNICGETFDSKNLLAYCTALNYYLTGPVITEGLNSLIIKNNISEQQYKMKFRIMTSSILGITFLTLIINFCVFRYYSTYNNSFDATTSIRNLNRDNYLKFSQQVDRREYYFKKNGWLKGYRFSLLADRIAATVPDSVILSSMGIFPLRAQINSRVGDLDFSRDTIIITGICKNPLLLRGWLRDIKSINRIKDVKIDSYAINSHSNENEFHLTAFLQ